MSKGRLRGFSATRLRQLRSQHRLTQRELAERIDAPIQSVRFWETGVQLPTPPAGKKLAAFFEIDLAELIEIDHSTCLLPDLRSPTGLSQRDAAQALGWTVSHLSLTERGARIPTNTERHALAALYQLDVALIAAAAQRTTADRAAAASEKLQPHTTTQKHRPQHTPEVHSLSEARAELNRLVRQAKNGNPVYLGSHRKPEVLLLSINDYEQLTRDNQT